MMVLPAVSPTPALRVIDGGSPSMRREEARVEAMSFFAEVEAAAAAIVNAVTGLPVPSMTAINEAGRIAYKAARAREEWLALTGGDAA